MEKVSSILVIDDEPFLRQTLSVILHRAGYAVTAAGSAKEGEEYLRQEQFDLVFLDLKMPDTSGLDFLPTIHQMQPGLPVLILTAHATLESALEAVRRGARDYLLKPIDPHFILERVCEVISENQANRRKQEIVKGMQGLLREFHEIEKRKETAKTGDPMPDKTSTGRYLQRGPLHLDLHAHALSLNGRQINLSPTALEYLTTLMRHSPNIISCDVLVAESQGYASSLVEAQELARWRVYELRKALEPNPKKPVYILTVRGAGYRLVA